MRWGTIAAATLEQALLSGTLFVVQAGVAHALGPVGFGRFALAFQGCLFGLAALTAFILDPLSARGRIGHRYGTLVGQGLAFTALTGGGVGTFLALTLTQGHEIIVGILFAPALALPALGRRIAHAEQRQDLALRLAVRWAGFCAIEWLVLVASGEQSLPSPLAFFVAFVAAGVAATVLTVPMPLSFPSARLRLLQAASAWHRRFGGWLGVAALFGALPPVLCLAVLAVHGGEAAAGDFRVLLLLAMPIAQVSAALGTPLQPRVADLIRHGETTRATRWAYGLSATVIGFGGLWLAVVIAVTEMLGPRGVILLFGWVPAQITDLLPWMVAAVAINSANAGPSILLRAQHRGLAIALCAGLTLITSTGACTFLIPRYGLPGAISAQIMTAVASLLAQAMMLRHRPQKERA